MITGQPHDEGHIGPVHGDLETDQAAMQGQGRPRRNSLSLAWRRRWAGQGQGRRSSGASRLGPGRRKVDPAEMLLRLVTQSPLEPSVTPYCSKRRTKLPND